MKETFKLAEDLEKMSDGELRHEVSRVSKNAGENLLGGVADIILVCLYRTHNKGNDPYMLERKSQNKNGFNMYNR